MKFRKYKKTIFFLLLSLISINIISYSFILYKPTEVSNNQETDQLLCDDLKLSLFQDWNISWDIGDNEYGYGVTIEESTGCIYITGYNETGVVSDLVLLKYDSNGNELWNVTFDSGNNEYGYDVALDYWGNVYVAGANGTDIYTDVLLLKYNSSGHLEWARSWDNSYTDGAWALDIDSDNNIYIVGRTYTTSKDLLILKYNSSGNYIWNSTIIAPDTQDGYDFTLDSMDNIYIVGVNGSKSSSHNVYTAKFDSLGNIIWNRSWGQYGFSDQGYGVALDSSNNVYATGKTNSYGAISFDYVTIKYDNDGNWQWNQTWGTNGTDEAQSIAVDSADNIYTCGFTTFSNVSIVKYSNSGNLIWEKTWANNSIYKYWWKDMVIDSMDRIYLTGYNRTGASGIYDISTTKFSIESPAGFKLTADCGAIDDDGIFNLNWSLAPRAANYSIYQYNSYISEINDTLTLIVNQTQTLSSSLTGYTNGTYYFKGVAFNNFGNSTSNCIVVTVAIPSAESTEPPRSFTLSSNAGNPDDDGNFTLTWTSSSGANNYSVYRYSRYISTINNSLTLLQAETNALSHALTGYLNGSYHFIVVASNNYGNTSSNNLQVDVEIPSEDEETEPGIPGYNLMFLISGFVATLSILIYRRLKLK